MLRQLGFLTGTTARRTGLARSTETTRAAHLLRALLVLTNLEVNR